MSDKKLPMTVEKAQALDAAIIKEIGELPQTPPSDPNLPETFKDPEALKSAVGAALGKPVKALAYGPFGEMLHEGAKDYLREEEPELWSRLQKHKFGS